jgi:hypothetical protein
MLFGGSGEMSCRWRFLSRLVFPCQEARLLWRHTLQPEIEGTSLCFGFLNESWEGGRARGGGG